MYVPGVDGGEVTAPEQVMATDHAGGGEVFLSIVARDQKQRQAEIEVAVVLAEHDLPVRAREHGEETDPVPSAGLQPGTDLARRPHPEGAHGPVAQPHGHGDPGCRVRKRILGKPGQVVRPRPGQPHREGVGEVGASVPRGHGAVGGQRDGPDVGSLPRCRGNRGHHARLPRSGQSVDTDPPATRRFVPVTKPARSDARNTTAATTSGLHGRPRPMFGRNAARAWVRLLMAALAME